MASVVLEIVNSFLRYDSDVWHSKFSFLVTLDFWLDWMKIISRYSNSNFVHFSVIYWSLFKVQIKSLHDNSYQKEAPTTNWYISQKW